MKLKFVIKSQNLEGRTHMQGDNFFWLNTKVIFDMIVIKNEI